MIAQTDRLIVRNWRDSDEELFYHINSDETVMAFFPMRRDRQQSREMMQKIRARIDETGFGFFALERKADGIPIGFAGLARTDLEPHLSKGTVEIGWRLAATEWRKGYATEAAEGLLKLGFEQRGLEEIVSFAVHDNTRSTAVMERIGMQHDPARDFDHPHVPDTYPHLRRHVLYYITAKQWKKRHG
ncbi:GNAT family N-acetyltransferase [Hoeflea sp. TYP-13]|uniref:GNAT family N-acetyltransferase n=1 Tax=Hoeflea sp. TYP-13 TaxID=3230023 RepID=UPI0034C5CD54